MKRVVYLTLFLLLPFLTFARVLIVVDSAYYNNNSYDIQGKNRVDRYVSAVQNIDNENVSLMVYNRSFNGENENIEELWKKLVGEYNYFLDRDTLSGIVFIGDIPVPKYYCHEYGFSSNDYVYMELYDDYNSGRYSDNTVFDSIWITDTITNYFTNNLPYEYGNYNPGLPNSYMHRLFDVWVSRIYAKNLTALRIPGAPWGEFLSEHEIISNYLDKVHERMTRPADKPSRALGFGDIERYRYWHVSLNPETNSSNAPSNARIGLSHEERLAIDLLPVDERYYIYNWESWDVGEVHTGDHRINTSSNFQSQLQAGPYGNITEGPFGQLVDNRYRHNNAPDSAPHMVFDPSDTLGWEWVGFLEHGDPMGFECNGYGHGIGSHPIARGQFRSHFRGAPQDVGFQKIIDNDSTSPFYYTTIRDLYGHDPRRFPTGLFFEFDEFNSGEVINLYFWVDNNMIDHRKTYASNAWMNIHQKRIEDSEIIIEILAGGLIDGSSFGGPGWMPVLHQYQIAENSLGFVASFHADHELDGQSTEFPVRAVRAVSDTGVEVIKTVACEDMTFGIIRPDYRFFTKMQDDSSQSKANFFLTNSCSYSNIGINNNVGLTLAMAHSGLISVGTSTVNLARMSYGDFVQEIADGSSVGDAFRHIGSTSSADRWNLFGAGTLRSRPYVPFRHPEDFTEPEMLSFARLRAWEKTIGNASIEQKENVLDSSDRHYKVTLWDDNGVDLKPKAEITALKGTGAEFARIGLTISFPEEPVNENTESLRGHITFLINDEAVGDVEIQTYGRNVEIDSFGMCHAYYEFLVPAHLTGELDNGLNNFTIRLASVHPGEWFLLKNVEFYEVFDWQKQIYEAADGDTVVVPNGTYNIYNDISVSDSVENAVIILEPGTVLNFADGGELRAGVSGRIIGAENVSISPQIILYNTPEPREPLEEDNVIGLFGKLCDALWRGGNGRTTMVGPGIFNFNHAGDEGLIGVMHHDRDSSTVIRHGFPDGAPHCEFRVPESTRPNSVLLLKNLRIEYNDDQFQNEIISVWGGGTTIFENCIVEGTHTEPANKTAWPIELGSIVHDRQFTGHAEFRNCVFRNCAIAVRVRDPMFPGESPVFVNTIFENNDTDLLFTEGAQAFCGIEANQLRSVQVGDVRYEGATAINNLINSSCPSDSLSLVANFSFADPGLVDPMASDMRLTKNSPLISAGKDMEDIGVQNTNTVFTFSRFLNGQIEFQQGQQLQFEGGELTTNTLGDTAQLRQKYTRNLRPVNEIRVRRNFINNPSVVTVWLNDADNPPPLPDNYRVWDAKINDIEFAGLYQIELPLDGTPLSRQAGPDNVPPAPVANLTKTEESGDVVLSWSPNTEPDLARYKLFRAPAVSPVQLEQIASVPGHVTQHRDVHGDIHLHTYRIVAYDSTGNMSSIQHPLRIKIKDNGAGENNITKPQIQIYNLSPYHTLSDFRLRMWFSREEFPSQKIIADNYYTEPSGVQITVTESEINRNIVMVDIIYPSGFEILPGDSTSEAGLQFGVHFDDYYPGQWDKSNDWSAANIGSEWIESDRIAVYSNGALVYGTEPVIEPETVVDPQPSGSLIFGFESTDEWSISQGTINLSEIRTEGSYGIEVSGGGYQELNSMVITTGNFSQVSEQIKLDLLIGNNQPNPYWIGEIKLHANCPSAGVYNQHIGQVNLTELHLEFVNTLFFDLPSEVQSALHNAHDDFSYTIILNTNENSGPYILDNMRFAQP